MAPGEPARSAAPPRRLALIPARSGSKRLPGKNIRLLGGHPLVAWSIRAALASGRFDRVIVSTDTAEIAEVAVRWGAEVPFLRPTHLSSDEAATIDVVLHLLETLAGAERRVPDELCLLQPTSPYRTAHDIVGAHALLEEKAANAVISVVRCAHPPAWTNILGPDGSMANFIAQQHANTRSQDLPVYHRLNGAIYWYRVEALRGQQTMYPDRTYAYEMDELRSVDIDTLPDFEYAEFLLERRRVPPFGAGAADRR